MKTRRNRMIEATLPSMNQWYRAMFQNLGWIVLAKTQGNREKIVAYKSSLQRLSTAINQRLERVHDEDNRDDLLIMKKNIEILVKHVNKEFKN